MKSDILVVSISGGMFNGLFAGQGPKTLIGTKVLLVDWDNIKESDSPVGEEVVETVVQDLYAADIDLEEQVVGFLNSPRRIEPPSHSRFVLTFEKPLGDKLNLLAPDGVLRVSAPSLIAAVTHAIRYTANVKAISKVNNTETDNPDLICDVQGGVIWSRELKEEPKPKKRRKQK